MSDLSKDYLASSTAVISSRSSKTLCTLVGVILLFTIVTVALTAATLGVVVKRLDDSSDGTASGGCSSSLVDRINKEELMKHLARLQAIADDQGGGTRAIATGGFNGTLDYITSELQQNTNFIIKHQYFTVKNYVLRGTPELELQANSIVSKFIYPANFTYMIFSSRAEFPSFERLVAIPNLGCSDADWSSVSAADAVALVKRGDCTFGEKVTKAEANRAKGLLIYNDGTAADRFQALPNQRSNLNTSIPVYILSYNLGIQLLNAANSASADAGIRMNIDISDAEGIGNICADTPSGDKEKTIVVGAHSDSVPAGSGINDNGSGSVGVLTLALNLARLLQSSSPKYVPYPYRVRFCWWGAEELGLLGSYYHVGRASSSDNNEIGERLRDYLLNLNYDMLAGPNYRFGIHDFNLVPANTPNSSLSGTRQITNLFRQWFNEQKLPWSNASLGGGSDYVPFLAAGLAVGGVNTGAGGIKPPAERDYYSTVLGTGNGGIANAAYDPCYHQQCDRINNINPFAYENVVKSAAYAIEYMGRTNDLEKWLYPTGRSFSTVSFEKYHIYDTLDDAKFY